jgi:hypothetical protein
MKDLSLSLARERVNLDSRECKKDGDSQPIFCAFHDAESGPE